MASRVRDKASGVELIGISNVHSPSSQPEDKRSKDVPFSTEINSLAMPGGRSDSICSTREMIFTTLASVDVKAKPHFCRDEAQVRASRDQRFEAPSLS